MSSAVPVLSCQRKTLDARAARIAAPLVDADQHSVLATVAVVQIGDEQYGLPAVCMDRLVPMPQVTPLPGAPEWITGLALVRGVVLTVVGLVHWLGYSESKTRRRYLAVVRGQGGVVGLAVDQVLGFRNIRNDEVAESFAAIGKKRGHPILMITRDLVAVLDIEQLLRDMCVEPLETSI